MLCGRCSGLFTPYDFASLWTCARREVLDGMDDLVRRGDEMAKPERGENYYQTARDWELDTLSYARQSRRRGAVRLILFNNVAVLLCASNIVWMPYF